MSARVCARNRLLGLGLGTRERGLGLVLRTCESGLGRGLGAGAHALRLGPRRLLQLLRGTLGRIDDGGHPLAGRGGGAAMLHLINGLGHLAQVVLYRLRVKTPAHLREVLPLNQFPSEFQVPALLDRVGDQRKSGQYSFEQLRGQVWPNVG